MKRILEIGVYKPANFNLEVIDLTDLKETVNKDTAVFIGHTTVTSRIRGQLSSDYYQVSKAYLRRLSQWCVVASQSARVAKTIREQRIRYSPPPAR